MINELVLATRNEDKVKEIQALFSDLNIKVLTLNEFPGAPDVVEDGQTLEENALKKARVIANYTGKTAVADDTGLEVDYLNGQPGVFSSRYSGENATYSENVEKLLKELDGVPLENRGAKFCCVVAICNNNETRVVKGICQGVIKGEPRGDGGFGYDPVFYVPEFDSTFAEMDLKLKNKISHRAKAFGEMEKIIEKGNFKIE